MQRNWELVREILLRVEAADGAGNWIEPSLFPDYPAEKVQYHIGLLIEAGYVNGTRSSDYQLIRDFRATSLTWQGHEFLDKIRSETIWKRTKNTALSKGIDLSVDVIASIASSVIEKLIFRD